MAIQNNYVAVSYKLYVKDEDDEQEALVEQCDSVHPFQFISNLQVVLPAFEQQVVGLKRGEKFDFVIPCNDAYGEFQDELMFDVPRSVFELDGRFDKERIFEGNIIPLQGEDGQRFNATVIEVKADAVTIDLNHPRAGQDLHFVGQVIENREATSDELTGMVNMMASDSCGCGCCGCDHDGCGHDGCGHSGCGGHHHDHDHKPRRKRIGEA
ncbi:MAG: FKBP-type peptidyl-prolyl cis-trans isomerase [Prevotellaceae bacterium]|nr:FKBP-type peptidyl-prolyl cis-trans isomerase [Prevotellaceae bacterium]